MEFIGLAPFGSGGVPAVDPRKDDVGVRAGETVMDVLRRNVRPLDIGLPCRDGFRVADDQLRIAQVRETVRLFGAIGFWRRSRAGDKHIGSRIAKCIGGGIADAAGTADDDHFFVKTGADGVDRDDIAALVFAVEIDRFNDQQLFALQPLVLLRRNDSA